ncbi:hypothetical protein FRC04_006072 [Tulasnella sp. 424]|nr:hypothetical protein FRC04_006072 [Tulasnella sp. 424]
MLTFDETYEVTQSRSSVPLKMADLLPPKNVADVRVNTTKAGQVQTWVAHTQDDDRDERKYTE